MAETKRMTAEEVVGYLLEGEGLDFLRESLTLGLPAADGGGGVGAGRRRPRRAGTRGAADAPQRLPLAAVADACGRDRARDPEAPPRQLLPELPRAAPALRAGARLGRAGGVRRRRLDAQGRPGGRVARAADLEERGLAHLPGLDEQVDAFRNRPLEGRYPYLWLDAKVEKVRDGGRVVRKALVLAYGVHESGYREVIALDVGEAETEAFWRSFLRGLVERGLTGVELVVSDAHAGLKKAIAQVLGCPWQRCSVHFLREALGHVRREQQGMVAALLRPLFNAEAGDAARALVGDALERLRKPLPKVAALLEEAEEDLLAFYAFPADHWPKLRSTNPLERVNREIGRRTDVVGIFPNDRSLIRLAASVVIEQNDEWLVGRRYLSNHSLEAVLDQEKKKSKDREEARELTAA